MNCFFVTDLHGSATRYQSLFRLIEAEKPDAVFLGGDLLPHGLAGWTDSNGQPGEFLADFFLPQIQSLKSKLNDDYPTIFLILGNDDPKSIEPVFLDGEQEGLWHYISQRKMSFGKYTIYGYSYVPPSPFNLKDWEKYDVSRYIGNGCISPEEGVRTIPIEPREAKYSTIKDDLIELVGSDNLSNAIFLFHTPPYKSKLDRAALDGKMLDYAPLDVHVGSIAVQRFLEDKQPLLSLHGHIHESARLTGEWQDRIGKTIAYSAAHDGDELALIRFDPNHLDNTTRELT